MYTMKLRLNHHGSYVCMGMSIHIGTQLLATNSSTGTQCTVLIHIKAGLIHKQGLTYMPDSAAE